MSNEETPDTTIWEAIQMSAVFDWMAQNGVAKLLVNFSGENDDGSFDSFVEMELTGTYSDMAYEAARNSLEAATVHVTHPGSQDNKLSTLVLDMSAAFENRTQHNIDWVNNEGGRGSVQWILDGEGTDGRHYKRGVCLEVEARVIEYQGESYAITGAVNEESVEDQA